MKFEEWLASVPESLRSDPIWKVEAYPKALLLFDLAWQDSDRLMNDVRGREIVRQLIRSVGSISANLDEGFGRGTDRREFGQFLRYALGSTREARSWYQKSRLLLPEEIIKHRMELCGEIIALLVTNINRQRRTRS